MNPLKAEAATRTKKEVHVIRHVYIDLDYGGETAPEAIHNLQRRSSGQLTSSPGKFQVVWTVEGLTLEESLAVINSLRERSRSPFAFQHPLH